MSLEEVTAENLRCLERIRLELHPGQNLIWGPNGSGKTSLLEAIFLLGRGRSFRTRNSERLIQQGKEQLVVFGRTSGAISHALGLQSSRNEGTVAKIDGAFVQSLVELSSAFAVQVIEPGIHRLVEEGSHRRRRWMDWAVFHVEPSFMDNWTRYTRAVKQRNSALRSQPEQAHVWDPEIARLGELISAARSTFVDQLQPYWARVTSNLVGIEVELGYHRGWVQNLSLAEALVASQERDRIRGLTHTGAHRADLAIRISGKPAREILSRGQQKLVAIAMTLAQLQLVREVGGVTPTLLLDDPAAELDGERLERFAGEVAALGCQHVVTALSADLRPLGRPDRVFHVEQGGVLPV